MAERCVDSVGRKSERACLAWSVVCAMTHNTVNLRPGSVAPAAIQEIRSRVGAVLEIPVRKPPQEALQTNGVTSEGSWLSRFSLTPNGRACPWFWVLRKAAMPKLFAYKIPYPLVLLSLGSTLYGTSGVSSRYSRSRNDFKGGSMLAILAAVLVVLWLLGFLAFHVSSGLIHILLVLAVISVVIHLFRGRSLVA